MNRSLNEISAHAIRAARGAGLSWGMAEEAGRATRWLASHDLAGPAALCDVLTKNDGAPHLAVAPVSLDGEWHAPKGDLCPLTAGAALNDCADRLAHGQPVTMVNVAHPLLILPFAAWAAIHLKQPVRVIWQNVQIDTDGDTIWIDAAQGDLDTDRAETLSCQLAAPRRDAGSRPAQRGTVGPDLWARLDMFAKRTFAPATEASRLLGAGAGVSDND